MIHPIVIYGDPVLTKRAEDISPDFPNLDQLIRDMFETMHRAHGVGLAAPQIGKSIRLFVVDASGLAEDEEDESLKDFRKTFINPQILEEGEDNLKYEEGCLSIPGIRESILRPARIRLRYQDESFAVHEEEFSGIQARIIQHEYDHLEGVLFIDHISAFKKSLIKGKLNNMLKGKVDANYPVRLPMKRARK